MRKIDSIIIHCSDSEFGDVPTIRGWHYARGFSDIGYHFVILNSHPVTTNVTRDCDGEVCNGRPIEDQGAHCIGKNEHSIGICLIGVEHFTEKQHKSLIKLIQELMEKYHISSDDIYSHAEFSDKTCPNFNVDDFVEEYIAGPDIIEGAKDSLRAIRDMSSDIVTDEEMLDCMQTLRRYFKQ